MNSLNPLKSITFKYSGSNPQMMQVRWHQIETKAAGAPLVYISSGSALWSPCDVIWFQWGFMEETEGRIWLYWVITGGLYLDNPVRLQDLSLTVNLFIWRVKQEDNLSDIPSFPEFFQFYRISKNSPSECLPRLVNVIRSINNLTAIPADDPAILKSPWLEI